jgi:hypothetical protein
LTRKDTKAFTTKSTKSTKGTKCEGHEEKHEILIQDQLIFFVPPFFVSFVLFVVNAFVLFVVNLRALHMRSR